MRACFLLVHPIEHFSICNACNVIYLNECMCHDLCVFVVVTYTCDKDILL